MALYVNTKPFWINHRDFFLTMIVLIIIIIDFYYLIVETHKKFMYYIHHNGFSFVACLVSSLSLYIFPTRFDLDFYIDLSELKFP